MSSFLSLQTQNKTKTKKNTKNKTTTTKIHISKKNHYYNQLIVLDYVHIVDNNTTTGRHQKLFAKETNEISTV